MTRSYPEAEPHSSRVQHVLSRSHGRTSTMLWRLPDRKHEDTTKNDNTPVSNAKKTVTSRQKLTCVNETILLRPGRGRRT